MENCSLDSREQMIQAQLEQMSPFNESTIECPDMTEDPVFIQKLSKDIMAFWKYDWLIADLDNIFHS